MSGTSEFYAAVYRLTALIPRGQAATYGQLAFLAGHPRASRIVGQAMARAPEGLPCHRVVYRDGRLSPSDIFAAPGSSGSCWSRRASRFYLMAASICPAVFGPLGKGRKEFPT